jgi:hypothetical protein
VEDMLLHVNPFFPFFVRIFSSNVWLFKPLLEVRDRKRIQRWNYFKNDATRLNQVFFYFISSASCPLMTESTRFFERQSPR